jgi:glycosyltransferase involved in cell wall biosynthesis
LGADPQAPGCNPTMRVHQMTTALVYGDAITNHTLEIDRRLKAWGLESHIYAEHIEPQAQHLGQSYHFYEPFVAEPGDLLIYHYSIYTSNLEFYKRSRNHKLVVYHNITPAEFYHGYDRGLELACQLGRLALPSLQGCDLALGVSDFNRQELVAAGIPAAQTDVMPIFLNLERLASVKRNEALYDEIKNNSKVNLLFVSRLVPNKACEELLKILHTYRHAIDEKVHLWLVGLNLVPRYKQYLHALTARLGLEQHVTFTDRVSLGDLCTYYQAADLFLCASRHEGFSVPLLESMYFDLPILAYKSSAVPDTLGQAGILFTRFDYGVIAETARILATDQTLRGQIIARQRQRLADFAPQQVEAKLRQSLERIGVFVNG